MLYTGNRIGGSNPPLSASKSDSAWQRVALRQKSSISREFLVVL